MGADHRDLVHFVGQAEFSCNVAMHLATNGLSFVVANGVLSNLPLLENCDHINKNSTDFCCLGQLQSALAFFHISLLNGEQNVLDFC